MPENETMKKSLLVTLDFPPNIGGVSVYYKNICENLPKNSIFVLAPDTAYHEAFDNNVTYTIYRKKMISKTIFLWPKWIPMIRQTKEIIFKEKIERILVGNILPCGSVAYVIKKKMNIPYHVFIHGQDLSMLYGIKKFLAKKILNKAQNIIVNSNFTRHLVENFGISTEKIITLYPCPNPLGSCNELEIIKIRNSYNLHDKKILLTVGRLVERKGHDKVIESLPRVIRKYDNFVYIIAGDGPNQKTLLDLTKKFHLENHIIFIKNISDKDLSCLYELCDIFIMASRCLKNNDYEGFGIVYLEANSFSKPVIAGKSGGVMEAVINNLNGILVNPQDTKEISDAIINLLDNPHYAHTLGLQGLDRVNHKFQWFNEVKKIENILQ